MTQPSSVAQRDAATPEAHDLGASERSVALELVRVTEAAAMAAARRMGFGDQRATDRAAADAMRGALDRVPMDGIVVIGVGDIDDAPMLYHGERLGDGSPPRADIALDPVGRTTPTAEDLPNALASVAVAERGTMSAPGACPSMETIATGRRAADAIDPAAPIGENLRRIAKVKSSSVRDVTVSVLHRPRQEQLVADICAAGARVAFVFDGHVAGAIMAARPDTSIDLSIGVGGTAEGVVAACAVKCLGGALHGRLAPRDERERAEVRNAGHDIDGILTVDDFVTGDHVVFAATGITDGALLRGVRFGDRGAATQSLSMRSSSGTVRTVDAEHTLSKFNAIARFAALDGSVR